MVGQVKYGGKRYILQRRGEPMAVLIGLEEYRRLQAVPATSVLPPAGAFVAASMRLKFVWTAAEAPFDLAEELVDTGRR